MLICLLNESGNNERNLLGDLHSVEFHEDEGPGIAASEAVDVSSDRVPSLFFLNVCSGVPSWDSSRDILLETASSGLSDKAGTHSVPVVGEPHSFVGESHSLVGVLHVEEEPSGMSSLRRHPIGDSNCILLSAMFREV